MKIETQPSKKLVAEQRFKQNNKRNSIARKSLSRSGLAQERSKRLEIRSYPLFQQDENGPRVRRGDQSSSYMQHRGVEKICSIELQMHEI